MSRFGNVLKALAAAFQGRDSTVYPRLFNLFGAKRPLQRFTPINLRVLSRSIYARRAINCIKDPIKQMKWEIRARKGVEMNSEIERQIKAATAVFERPNESDNFMSFVEQVIEDYLAVSAGVYEQRPQADKKKPLMMWPVDSQSIQIYAGWAGGAYLPRYAQTMGLMMGASDNSITFLDIEMTYIRPNPSTETPYGYGPLEIAARSIARQLGVSEYAGNLASNATPGVLMHFANGDDTTIRKFRDYWANEIEGQGVMPIVGGDKEPKSVNLHPEGDDALYPKWQQFLIHEIATAFGIHVLNFNPMVSMSGDLAQFAEDQDWKYAIRPTAKTLQTHFTQDTLHKAMGFYSLEFSFDGLDREDEKELAEIYKIYYQNNLTTPNDFRVNKLGLDRFDNQWSDATYGDMQIAIGSARRGSDAGTGDLLDSPELVKNKDAAPNRHYPGRG
jgi:HK97 family phage portal protein